MGIEVGEGLGVGVVLKTSFEYRVGWALVGSDMTKDDLYNWTSHRYFNDAREEFVALLRDSVRYEQLTAPAKPGEGTPQAEWVSECCGEIEDHFREIASEELDPETARHTETLRIDAGGPHRVVFRLIRTLERNNNAIPLGAAGGY